MLLLTEELPIHLEILDYADNPIADMEATLNQLCGEHAVLTLSDSRVTGRALLHWGARVRFCIGDNAERYTILGAITSMQDVEDTDQDAPHRELTLRLLECHSAPEKRILPRRHKHFTVQYRPLYTPLREGEEPAEWMQATCLNIGGGGMRMRVAQTPSLPERIALNITLPATQGGETFQKECFELKGRVLRTEAVRRTRSMMDIAVRFERLTVAQGLRLSDYLTGE